MKQTPKKTTLKKKVLITMIILVIFQVITIPGILLLIQTPKRLDSSNIQILRNSTAYRGNVFGAQMADWSDLSSWIAETSEIMQKMEELSGQPIHTQIDDKDFRRQLLDEFSDTVLENLRRRNTTGAFVILDGPNSDRKDSIYLRDLNPDDVSESNHDILVEAGLDPNVLENGFTLDIYWAKQLKLGEDRSYYTKPVQTAAEHPELEAANLGYWSDTVRIIENDMQVISYTVPLLDSTHTPYGVIGIDLSLDYLHSILDGSEISIDENACYLLAKSLPEAGTDDIYRTVYVGNSYCQRQFETADTIRLSAPEKNQEIRHITDDGYQTGYVCASEELRLYSSNTPFSDEQWILCGTVEEDRLYESSKHFMFALMLALAISLGMGILCSVLTTSFMFRPLWKMMDGLKKVSFTVPMLSRTNIAEIDELAIEVERLRQNAFHAGSKVADIIDMSNVPLGIYEFNNTLSNEVFCTRRFFELTELPQKGWNENYMQCSLFRRLLKSFQEKCTPLPDEKNICFFVTKDGSPRYLEIKNVSGKNEELYIYMDVTSQMLEKEKIRHERDYDVLTNLYNRRAFIRIVSDLIDNRKISSGVLSMWDLDNLKFINDTYGHDMGDKYICMLADVFHKFTAANSVIARISGDEFMVFFYNAPVDEMCALLEKIHASFLQQKIVLPDNEALSVSVSAGISVYEEDSERYESLAKQADFAMYEIKHKEKGRIRRFNRETYEKDYIFVQGIGELNKIIEENRIRFVYQPIFDIRTKEVFAYETLMRPLSKILYNPTLLLRIAKRQSKLHLIEKLTWFQAIAQFEKEVGFGRPVKLFLNSISNQTLSDSDFETLAGLYGDHLSNVVMEITESKKTDEQAEQKKRDFCRSHGIEIAMDDYGAGYSTNAVLMNSPFNYVKIDISMIKNIHLSNEKQTFVKGVIHYCHQCGTRVIAEGVETQEEYDMIQSLGVDYAQGYFIARPAGDIRQIQIDFDKL